jgi:hypothetical protein
MLVARLQHWGCNLYRCCKLQAGTPMAKLEANLYGSVCPARFVLWSYKVFP